MTQPAATTPKAPMFDRPDQLQRIQAYVIPGENLVAVFDCKGIGTGFVGFTDRRLIFYDQQFLSKHKAMVSIPYKNIVGVASADEGIVFKSSQITLLTSAGSYHFEFRGSDKAHMAYRYIMKQILGMDLSQA